MSGVTGTLILEDRGNIIKAPDGRHIVMVVGMIAMSPEDAETFCACRPMQQYVQGHAGGGLLRLGIADGMQINPLDAMDFDTEEERKSAERRYYTMRVDQLVTSPIWRV